MHRTFRLLNVSVLPYLLLSLLWAGAELLPTTVSAQERTRCVFDLPADTAEKTLKLFSQQSGRALIMSVQAVKGIRTKAVQGELTPLDALARMLAGTGLEVVEDAPSGSLAVRKSSPPSETRTAGDMGKEASSKKKRTIATTPPQP